MADEDNNGPRTPMRRIAGPPPPRGPPPPTTGASASRRSAPLPRGPPPGGPSASKADPVGSDRRGSGGSSHHNDPGSAGQDDKDQSLSAVQRWRMKRLESSGSNNGAMDGSGGSLGRRDTEPDDINKDYGSSRERRDSEEYGASPYHPSRASRDREGRPHGHDHAGPMPQSSSSSTARRGGGGERGSRDHEYGPARGAAVDSEEDEGNYYTNNNHHHHVSARGHGRRPSTSSSSRDRPPARSSYRGDEEDGDKVDGGVASTTTPRRSSLGQRYGRRHDDDDGNDDGVVEEEEEEQHHHYRDADVGIEDDRRHSRDHRTPRRRTYSASDQGERRSSARDDEHGEPRSTIDDEERRSRPKDDREGKGRSGSSSEDKPQVSGVVGSSGKAKKKKKRGSKGDETPAPAGGDDKASAPGGVMMSQQHKAALQPRIYDTDKIPILLKELLAFVTNPFERDMGVVLRCFIERSRGMMNALSPVYTLYSDNENGSGRMLMAARKVVKSKTPYYVFSTNTDDLVKPRSERSKQYLGKLRGNTNSTEYILYDNGEAPFDLLGGDDDDDDDSRDERRGEREDGKFDRSRLRRELAVMYYNYGLSEESARKVEVIVPKVLRSEERPSELLVEMWQPTSDRHSMAEAFRRIRFQGAQNVLEADRLTVMHQKETRYDPLSSCLVDFKGRATAASVKNFQLIKSNPEDKEQRDIYYGATGEGRDEVNNPDAPTPILLQMGRVGRDCFNMDLQHPLSILQAFAICVSRFDTKSKWA